MDVLNQNFPCESSGKPRKNEGFAKKNDSQEAIAKRFKEVLQNIPDFFLHPKCVQVRDALLAGQETLPHSEVEAFLQKVEQGAPEGLELTLLLQSRIVGASPSKNKPASAAEMIQQSNFSFEGADSPQESPQELRISSLRADLSSCGATPASAFWGDLQGVLGLPGDKDTLGNKVACLCQRYELHDQIKKICEHFDLLPPSSIKKKARRADQPDRGRKPRQDRGQEAAKNKQKELLFMATMFINGLFPLKDPKKGSWKREDGNRILYIDSGKWNNPKTGEREDAGIPYGKLARLIMLQVITEAVRSKSPKIPFARTCKSLTKDLGLKVGGGANGSLTRVREQANRLFRATIVYEQKDACPELDSTDSMLITENMNVLWELKEGEGVDEDSYIVLSSKFFREVCAHSVPLDAAAARSLLTGKTGSITAFDLYTILAKRVFGGYGRTKAPQTVLKWEDLEKQMGNNYGRLRAFREKIKKALTLLFATGVWPEAKKFIKTSKEGLVIEWRHAQPHISGRRVRPSAKKVAEQSQGETVTELPMPTWETKKATA